ncbi:MAG: hypothetical protein LBM02_06180 [Lachnospiraceae bacterium]|jgi:predicted amidophosphoribosyltransferase|nr:hypothetical protein [Lachnospiraceae bacterium]
MICKVCSSQIPDNVGVCPVCGTRIRNHNIEHTNYNRRINQNSSYNQRMNYNPVGNSIQRNYRKQERDINGLDKKKSI